MTYSPIQLKAIRIFGKKDLTEGCKVKAEMFGRDEYFTCIGMRRITEGVGIYQYDKFEQDGVSIEILGHEPHLEDVFRVANEKDWIIKIEYNYFKQEYVGITIDNSFGEDDIYALISYNPTLPLLQQSEETKQELIKLFS